jgi:hypothetical protein
LGWGSFKKIQGSGREGSTYFQAAQQLTSQGL